MIDRSHALRVARRAQELGISRGGVYYLPRPTSAADLAIMRRIDALHMEFPFAGSGMLATRLPPRHQDWPPARLDADEEDGDPGDLPAAKHLETAPAHKIYPYLLRKLAVTRPTQVWVTDITYIRWHAASST
jgi:putative transposase